MADVDRSSSQTAPPATESPSQPQSSPPVTEVDVVIKDQSKSQDRPSELSAIEISPEEEAPPQQIGFPSYNAPAHSQPVGASNYFCPTNPYSYTPIAKAAPKSDVSSDESDSSSPMGLSGIRVFLTAVAIVLLCCISAGAGFLGAHSYYKERVTNSCEVDTDLSLKFMEVFMTQLLDVDTPYRTPSDANSVDLAIVSEDSENIQCEVVQQKKVFPNVDFALMGYHILKGFPLSRGSDAGLTKPIFKKSTNRNLLSSDGHCLVPDGLQVVQDIGCMTSFSSKMILEVQELELYLGDLVHFDNSGWGPPFSVNTHYRSLVHTLQNEKKYLIISSLSCQTYKVNLNVLQVPSLDDSLMNWITKLIISDQDSDIIEFVSSYGTHYLKSVTYGAKYFFIYRLTRDDYHSLKADHISVLDKASYASMARLFPEKAMENAWLEKVEDFNLKVQMDAVVVGATPPDTDVTDWYDLVKTQPMPIEYDLESIEDLFTDDLGNNLVLNVAKVRQKLNMIKLNSPMEIYQNAIERSCVVHNAVVAFPENTCLGGSEFERSKHNYLDCMNLCMDKDDCLAASHDNLEECKLFRNTATNLDSHAFQNLEGSCQAVVLPYRLEMSYTFSKQQDIMWIVIVGARIVSKTAVTGFNFSSKGCQDACVISGTACVATSYHSTNVCAFLTSFDIITGNVTVTGEPDSLVSFFKLC